MLTENKKNITGLKFPGNDTIYILQPETSSNFNSSGASLPADAQAVGVALDEKVSLNGTTPMTGELNMGAHKITNLATPFASSDAATVEWVNNQLKNYQPSDGTIPGDIQQQLNALSQQISNKANTSDLTLYVAKNGSTMTGDLSLGGHSITNIKSPTLYSGDNDVATVGWVNTQITNAELAGKEIDLTPYIRKDGSIPMSGSLNLNFNRITNLSGPSSESDAATKNYVDTSLLGYATKESVNGKQNKNLVSKRATFSNWTLSGNDAFPYQSSVQISGVSADDYPLVSFDLVQASSGKYSSVAQTSSEYVTIYATDDPGAIQADVLILKG